MNNNSKNLSYKRLIYHVKKFSQWNRIFKYPGLDKGKTYKKLILNIKKAAIEFTIIHGL